MMSDVLVVMSGLPGSGKSTIADRIGRELGAAILSVDPIEAAIWRCGIPPSIETGVAAYEVAAVLAEEQLASGLTVIVDAVSAVEAARERWRQAAASVGDVPAVIEVVCSDEDLHRRRLAARRRTIPGFPDLSWADVQERRRTWEPWTGERLVIDTVGGLDATVADALAYLRG
jgi:predicted kinase